MTRQQSHTLVWATLCALLASGGLCAAQSTAQAVPDRVRQSTTELLREARAFIDAAALDQAIEKLGLVIDQARPLRQDREMRLMLAQAYAYRARAHFVIGNEARARADLAALVETDAEYTLDQESPQQLRTQHAELVLKTVGTIVFDVPEGAAIEVDGLGLPSGTRQYRVVQGNHRAIVSAPGQPVRVRDVEVRPATLQTVTVTSPPLPPKSPKTGQIERSQVTSEWRRRGMIHSSVPLVLYASSSSPSGRFSQTIYGRSGNFDMSQSPGFELGAYEIGGSYAISPKFGLGLTYSKSQRLYRGELSGFVPISGSLVQRPVSGVRADTRDIERAYHVEIRGQFGGRRHETVLSIGPSFIDLDRDYVRGVTVTELGGTAVTVAPVHTRQEERQGGLNMGLDVGWFPTKFLGIGFGTRYVVSKHRGATTGVDSPANQSILFTMGLRTRF